MKALEILLRIHKAIIFFLENIGGEKNENRYG